MTPDAFFSGGRSNQRVATERRAPWVFFGAVLDFGGATETP